MSIDEDNNPPDINKVWDSGYTQVMVIVTDVTLTVTYLNIPYCRSSA